MSKYLLLKFEARARSQHHRKLSGQLVKPRPKQSTNTSYTIWPSFLCEVEPMAQEALRPFCLSLWILGSQCVWTTLMLTLLQGPVLNLIFWDGAFQGARALPGLASAMASGWVSSCPGVCYGERVSSCSSPPATVSFPTALRWLQFSSKWQIYYSTSMTTEDFLINNSSYRQTVKTISECLPQFNIKSSFAYKKGKQRIKESITVLIS